MLPSIWNWLVSKGGRKSQRAKKKRLGTKRRAPLLVEPLEDRTLPTVTWINPAGGDWDTGTNWSTGVRPAATDDVVISQAVTITHASAIADSINSLTANLATLNLSAGS